MASTLVLIRHGETEWTLSRQHTGTTDIPLTENGRKVAGALGDRLSAWEFGRVVSSPRQRALVTAQLALPGRDIELDEDLVEWNYGEYEGITTADIHEKNPSWNLWTDGSPGGEMPSDVALRCDRFLDRARGMQGDVAVFAHGHVLRVLAARWIGMEADAGRHFGLDTATISVLGHEHHRPVLRSWNTNCDVGGSGSPKA